MPRWTMTPRTWLVCLLVYASVALALDGWAMSRWQRTVDPAVSGSLGAHIALSGSANRARIVSMTPDSPLLAAGAAVGDVVKFDLFTDISRLFGKSDSVGLTLFQGAASRHLTLSPTARGDDVSLRIFIVNWAGNLVGVLCGVLLAIRRSDPGPHRVLAILLITQGFGSELHGLPQPFHELYFRFAYPFLLPIGWLSFPFFAMVFPAEAPLWRRAWARRLFLALVAWCAGPILLKTLGREGLLGNLWAPNPVSTFMEHMTGPAVVAFGFAALWISWRRSRSNAMSASSRQVIKWIGFNLGLSYLTFVIVNNNEMLGYPLPPEGLFEVMTIVRGICYILLAYALMGRRLFDAGFVLNRALVVAIISSMLLVIFAVTEFAVDKLLHFHGRETSIVIDAAVALGVILGFHRIQHFVNHHVNHFFFHQWHEAASALREFLRGASHVSDPAALQDKFLAAICRFADADGAACYRAAPSGQFAAAHHLPAAPAPIIDANDDLPIALQRLRTAVEHGGGWALPMLLRGNLSGFVLIGAKRSGLAYRPDELDLLQKAAQQLVLDLESLRVLALEQERDAWRHSEQLLRARCDAFEDLLRQQLAGANGMVPASVSASASPA